jgi:hypothetical protein
MSLQVGAPTLHFEATRQPNHVVAKAHTQDRAHRGCRQRERPDIDTRHDQLRAGRNCGKVPRAIPCLEIAQRPHCSSKSRTDSVSSRCRSQAWDLRCRLAGQNISPWIHRQAAAAPAVQACSASSTLQMQSPVGINVHVKAFRTRKPVCFPARARGRIESANVEPQSDQGRWPTLAKPEHSRPSHG